MLFRGFLSHQTETYPLSGDPLRRLFSTFAGGWPGAGLLLMRVVAGTVLIGRTIAELRAGVAIDPAAVSILATVDALLLLAGLWTPIAGLILAGFELWSMFVQRADPAAEILLATVGGALALLGPGAWSVDARLFGLKRIDFTHRPESAAKTKNHQSSP